MLDRLPMPHLPLLLSWRPRVYGRHTQKALLPLGFAIALAAVGGLYIAPGPALAADQGSNGPSIQYQESRSHSAKKYTFAPGTAVTVPYTPRPGDATVIDGAPPIALPAAQGSAGVAPSVTKPAVVPTAVPSLLRREVYGFLPYWELGTTLDYDALSTIAYFGVDLNTTGTLNKAGNGWNGWVGATMTSVINNAHAHGTRVALTIESFAWDSAGQAAQIALLSSPTASLLAAQQIAAEVGRRGADGVNLDFEPVAAGQSNNYIAFVKSLRVELDKVHPGYELTFCGTGRPSTYDLAHLLAPGAADAVFIMGYDFRGGSPATTGSIDPLKSSLISWDLTDAVLSYIGNAPASKVILGLPWYGHAWSTNTANTVNVPPADPATYGQPAAVYYSTAAALSAITDPTHLGKLYDTNEQTAWTAYYGTYGGAATWRELYFDDAQAIGAKCDAIDAWNLRGAGIWALGYDNNGGDGDLTNAIAAKFEVSGTTFHAVAPARILDSRTGLGGLPGAFSANVARTFQVTGLGGVPAGATAVTGNLTVTQQGAAGYLYAGPVAANNPTNSTLNFPMNDDRANAVTVSLGTGGKLSITYVASVPDATAQVIFDVTGYFTPDTTGASYHSVSPTRVLDTRTSTGLAGKFTTHVARTLPVWGAAGVPSGAVAITGNLTVTQQTSHGYLYAGPTSSNNPTTSTLNFPMADDRANAVNLALSATGTLSITYVAPTAGQSAQVILDITGYYTPDATGTTYVSLPPTRILDSRDGTGGLSGQFSSQVARTFRAAGSGGIPSNATAITGNLTVTQQSSLGYLFMGPVAMNLPTSSALNFPVGDDRANSVTVSLAADGTVSITFTGTGPGATAHVIFDVTGYYGS